MMKWRKLWKYDMHTNEEKCENYEKDKICQLESNYENDDNEHVEQWWTCMRLWKNVNIVTSKHIWT